MPLHGEVQVVEAEPARQVQFGVEGIDNQFVTVAAVGRCHAAVAGGFFDVEFAQHARPAVRPLNVVGSAQAFVFGNGSALQVGNQPVRPNEAAGGNRIGMPFGLNWLPRLPKRSANSPLMIALLSICMLIS